MESTSKRAYQFSYIIPALNEEKYVGKCIRAITRQRYKPHEVIVVDNGSKDGTRKIARQFGARVLREKKRGIAHARNCGAHAATGDILCFIDADSEIHSDWADRVTYHLDRGSSAVVGINIFTHTNPLKFIWYNTYTVVAHTLLAINNFLFGKLHLGAGNLAIKKNVFFKTGGYDPYVGEDYWLSRKFWKLRLKGSFDPAMIVYSSSRGFDESGFLRTIWYWVKSTPRKVDQRGYTYKDKV
jgi:glycosyltransferase involved in cell wall biosynthesis